MVKNVLQGELSPVILQYDTPGNGSTDIYKECLTCRTVTCICNHTLGHQTSQQTAQKYIFNTVSQLYLKLNIELSQVCFRNTTPHINTSSSFYKVIVFNYCHHFPFFKRLGYFIRFKPISCYMVELYCL